MLPSDCELIIGQALRPMFGLELSADQMEALILEAHRLSTTDVQRRQDRDLL